jgi:hypothetical protein
MNPTDLHLTLFLYLSLTHTHTHTYTLCLLSSPLSRVCVCERGTGNADAVDWTKPTEDMVADAKVKGACVCVCACVCVESTSLCIRAHMHTHTHTHTHTQASTSQTLRCSNTWPILIRKGVPIRTWTTTRS